MSNTPSTDSGSTDWLSPIITDAVTRPLCTTIHCTTCGASEFRQNVLQAMQKIAGDPTALVFPMVFARTLARGLANLRPDTEQASAFFDPTRLLLYEIWSRGVLTDVEPVLAGTWAGEVLDRMKARAERGRSQQEADDPVRVKERREAKRRARQEQHAERLKEQAERARKWHLENDDPSGPS